ncbi:MAG: phenylacetate--CoA ligase [Desulfitibacter sp. BRH_c19]|nr:MAG: phenylacetate--CoA ligase [Desulfitibacter sp. BRH_c19]
MVWSREETIAREELNQLQLNRLQDTVMKIYNNVPFYRKRLDEMGVKPEDIQSLEDVTKLPFTTKDDFRDNYPYGLFAVPMDDVVRLHASSGTTGKSTVVGYTQKDLNTWTEVVARIIKQAGVTNRDIVQVAFGYGLFTGAFGLHYGLEKVGATVVPTSSGGTEKQIMIMKDFGTTVLVSTPSYALHMAEVAEKMGLIGDLKLRVGLFGAEGCSDEMRKEIEKRWGIIATDNYGLSEVIGPGVSGECEYKQGMHISEDHFLVEVIDPHTLQSVKPGQKGELVFTTLTKEALPVIRYRTKDISYIMQEPCHCGRTTARMAKVSGRSDDMLIIRGVNVFPSQIESVLMEIDGIAPHYQLVVSKKNHMDQLEVKVEVTAAALTRGHLEIQRIERTVTKRLQSVLSIKAVISIMEPFTMERFQGKAKRVIDMRQKAAI